MLALLISPTGVRLVDLPRDLPDPTHVRMAVPPEPYFATDAGSQPLQITVREYTLIAGKFELAPIYVDGPTEACV